MTYIDSAGLCALYDFLDKFGSVCTLRITGLSLDLVRIFRISGLALREGVVVESEHDSTAPGPRLQTHASRKGSTPRTWSQSFPSDMGQLRSIRDYVKAAAAESRLEDEQIFNLKVAVSEASANAIEHGAHTGHVVVDVALSATSFSVVVTHPGAFKVRAAEDPTRANRGMGIPLMLALVDQVSIGRVPGGGTRTSLAIHLDPAARD